MATILTKKKDTTGAPVAGDLTNAAGGAELAVNTADKRLYTKDSGGNVVEIGTNPTTLTAGVSVISANSSSAALRITQEGAGNALVVEDSTNPDSTPTVIDASGQVFIGHTGNAGTTSTNLTPSTQIVGTGSTAGNANSKSSVGHYRFFNDNGAPGYFFFKSRSGSPGTYATVNDGDALGTLFWQADDGTSFPRAASISAAVDGTPGTNDMPGRLVFSTTADGASSPTERMRIDSTGKTNIKGDAQFDKAIIENVYTISDGAAFEIDPGNGTIQLITLGASRTPKATNFAAGESVTLMVDDGSAYTLTWTDSTFGGSGVVWKTNGGVAPTLNTSGYTVITLWKVSTQVYGARVGDA
jgi:hypothetical protein